MATHAEKTVATVIHRQAFEPVVRKLAAEGITGTTRIAHVLNDAGHLSIKDGLWTPAQMGILPKRLGSN